MEKNKNEILFTYIDSLDSPDLLRDYQSKKPSLNQYAENYLANLNTLKSLNDFNRNNSKKNFNDNNSSVKALSSDKTNNDSIINTNILSNSISKINGIFNSYRSEEYNAMDKLKSKDNLEIEHLKKNFKIKTNSPDYISKIDDINITKKDNMLYFSNVNQNKFKNLFPDFYKKISPSKSKGLNSPLFSALKSSDSNYSSFKVFIKDNKLNDKLNFSKRLNSNNDIKNNRKKSFLLPKRIKDKNNKVHKIKKEFSKSFLYKNKLTNYMSSDGGKIKKKVNNNNKHSIRLQISKFSEIHNTDDSISQIHNYTQRNRQNKSNSQSIEDYWKEKELKKKIKIERIRKEKILKEKREMRDRPKINENSRKIAERITSNSSINVFDRLSGLKKSQLIYSEKISDLKIENSLSRFSLNTERIIQNYNNKSKIQIGNDNYFNSFKQIEKNNKKLIEKFNNNKDRKIDIEKKHNLNKIKQFIKTNINQRNSFVNKKENIKFIKKGLTLCNITENEIITKSFDKNNNIKPNLIKSKIMYKKVKLKNNLIEKEVQNRENNLENNRPIDKDIIYKIDRSIQINRNNDILLNYNLKEKNNSTSFFDNKNQILDLVNIGQIKKNNNIRINNRPSYIKNSKNIKEENINILTERNERINNMLKNYHCSVYNKRNENKTELNDFKNIIISGNQDNNQYFKNAKNNNLNISKFRKSNMDSISHFENESLIGNNLFNSFISNIDNHRFNGNNNENHNTINSNLIDTKKYFKIPLKSEFKNQKDLRARIKTDYSTYNNNNFIINDNKFLSSAQVTNNNEISHKFNYQMNDGMNNGVYKNEFIKRNMPKNDINRRRLELLKLLNFSSKIGIDE